MADDIAKRDANRVVTLLGVTDDASADIKRLLVDAATGRLKVTATVTGLTFADAETPSGTVDGSNKTFTLANTPSPAASLQLFVNGQYMTAGGVDYTLATATITTVTAPPTGSIIRAYYRY